MNNLIRPIILSALLVVCSVATLWAQSAEIRFSGSPLTLREALDEMAAILKGAAEAARLKRENQRRSRPKAPAPKKTAFSLAEHLAEDKALKERMSALFKTKYEAQLRANRQAFEQWEGYKFKEAEVAAGIRKERELYTAYYSEVVPLWMEMCASQRDRAQALIAEGRSVDEFHAAATGQQGLAAGAQNQAFFMARLALGCQAKVTKFP